MTHATHSPLPWYEPAVSLTDPPASFAGTLVPLQVPLTCSMLGSDLRLADAAVSGWL